MKPVPRPADRAALPRSLLGLHALQVSRRTPRRHNRSRRMRNCSPLIVCGRPFVHPTRGGRQDIGTATAGDSGQKARTLRNLHDWPRRLSLGPRRGVADQRVCGHFSGTFRPNVRRKRPALSLTRQIQSALALAAIVRSQKRSDPDAPRVAYDRGAFPVRRPTQVASQAGPRPKSVPSSTLFHHPAAKGEEGGG